MAYNLMNGGTVLVVITGTGAAWYVVRKRKDGGDDGQDA